MEYFVSRVLAGRVSELERRLSTGGGSEASESLPSSPGARGQGGERAVVGLQLASTKLMDGYIPPAGPNRFKGDEIFNDPRLRNILCPHEIRKEEGMMRADEEIIGQGDAVITRPEEVTGEKNEEKLKFIDTKNSTEISEKKPVMEISKEKRGHDDEGKKSLDKLSIHDRKEDCNQCLHHEENSEAENMVLVNELSEHHHHRNTRVSKDTSEQHNVSIESTKSCDTDAVSTNITKKSLESTATSEDNLDSVPACEIDKKNFKIQEDKNVLHTPDKQRITDNCVSISLNKSASPVSSMSGNGEEKPSIVQNEGVKKDQSRLKESRGKKTDESCVQDSRKEVHSSKDFKPSLKSDSAKRESQTTLNLTDELEEIIPIDQLDSYIREVRRGAGRVGKKGQGVEERVSEVENTRVAEEQVERLDVKAVEIVKSDESLENQRETQTEEKLEEVGTVMEKMEDEKKADHKNACINQDEIQKVEYSNGESYKPENTVDSMNDVTSGTTPHNESNAKEVKTPCKTLYKNYFCSSDVGNYLSEDEDTSFNLDMSDYDSDDDKLDAALQAWQSDVSKKDKKRGSRGSRDVKSGITLAHFPPFSG